MRKLHRKCLIEWWRREDSNLRHGAYETPALPPELRRRTGGPSRKVTGLDSGSQASAAASSSRNASINRTTPGTGSVGTVYKFHARRHQVLATRAILREIGEWPLFCPLCSNRKLCQEAEDADQY